MAGGDIDLPLLQEHAAEVVVGGSASRLEPHGLCEMRNRLRETPLPCQRGAQIRVRAGETGIQLEGALVLPFGLGRTSKLLQHVPEVVEPDGIIGRVDRAAQYRFRVLKPAEIRVALADLDQRLQIVADHLEMPVEVRQRLLGALELLKQRPHLVHDVRVVAG